ncbi:MAG: phosphoserine transaminase [Rhodospirillales bacterium]|nr:phosphoserine transaminase [Rhodospirillales bacterium]
MATSARPTTRPANPQFSSGPCAKRPGWSVSALSAAMVGRSHRGKTAKARIELVIAKSRAVLGLPDGWRLGIVPASDTGAIEMALWSLLGQRPVDVISFDSFGAQWAADIKDELKLKDARIFSAPYGAIPDLAQVNFDHDVVFTWNGTTSGARVPSGDWITEQRGGLTICDATSAIFAMALPWSKLDVVTYSWQKVLGGEAAHGMLALSPRAIERLQTYNPPWPLPKIFRLAKKGKVSEGVFSGETINTPSMLAVEDALDSLLWAESVGGAVGLQRRTDANFQAIAAWVARTPWVEFLAKDPATRSPTSVCLVIADPTIAALKPDYQAKAANRIVSMLDAEGVAFDIGAYRDAPPGLRIWAGATVETLDLVALFPWLDWAFAQVKAERAAAE